MKRQLRFVAIIMVTLTATALVAQRGPMSQSRGGWGPGSPYSKMYNPQTVETVSGQVISIDHITPMKGMSYGVHLMLKTDKETIPVHLGPGWYIDNQEVKLAPNDRIEVRGSRITFEGRPAIVAAEVKKGDEVLTLRDANGFPAWSGWRRR